MPLTTVEVGYHEKDRLAFAEPEFGPYCSNGVRWHHFGRIGGGVDADARHVQQPIGRDQFQAGCGNEVLAIHDNQVVRPPRCDSFEIGESRVREGRAAPVEVETMGRIDDNRSRGGR
jgi:hypothetical protein